jgi:hypothetical protein
VEACVDYYYKGAVAVMRDVGLFRAISNMGSNGYQYVDGQLPRMVVERVEAPEKLGDEKGGEKDSHNEVAAPLFRWCECPGPAESTEAIHVAVVVGGSIGSRIQGVDIKCDRIQGVDARAAGGAKYDPFHQQTFSLASFACGGDNVAGRSVDILMTTSPPSLLSAVVEAAAEMRAASEPRGAHNSITGVRGKLGSLFGSRR